MRLESYSRPRYEAGHSAFAMAMCLLGVMALTQLVVAGLALAVRFKDGQSIRVVEREVVREVLVESDTAAIAPTPSLPAPYHQTPLPPVQTHLPQVEPTPLAEPAVEDPEEGQP